MPDADMHLMPQALSFFSECPEDAVCGLVLDLVVSSVVMFPYQYMTTYTYQLANTAQCALTGSLFQVCFLPDWQWHPGFLAWADHAGQLVVAHACACRARMDAQSAAA